MRPFGSANDAVDGILADVDYRWTHIHMKK